MATVREMLNRFRALDLEQIAATVISRDPEKLADLNRQQLRKGKDAKGGWLLRYSEDPFFKTPQAADNYAQWKQRLGHTDPEKPFDVADYFINGYTHNTITARVSGRYVTIGSNVSWAGEIEQKNDNEAFGLNEESKEQYRGETLLPGMRGIIKQQTGAQ